MTKKELNEYLAQDAKNAGIKGGIVSYVKHIIVPVYTFNYIKLLRKSTFYLNSQSKIAKLWGAFMYIRLHRLSSKLGFYIPKDVFGPGLYIPHFGSVIVNPNSKVGANCLINNNVVIGQQDGKCPVIGDNVFIGAGAVICGDVHIANNVWIGANSVVTSDITEDGVLVAGSPAKVVKKKKRSWVDINQGNNQVHNL